MNQINPLDVLKPKGPIRALSGQSGTMRYVLLNENGETIASCAQNGFEAIEKNYNNAKRLAHCWNTHSELLKACVEMRDLLNNSNVRFKICDGGKGNLGETSLYHYVMKQSSDAIRAAKGNL